MSDLRFDIASLHAAYAAGTTVDEMLDAVFARHRGGG